VINKRIEEARKNKAFYTIISLKRTNKKKIDES
jgi:hypothetical protein